MFTNYLLTFLNDFPHKLTLREIDVLSCLMSGKSTKTCAHFLNIEVKTFETHTANLRNKLNFSSKDYLISAFEKQNFKTPLLIHYSFLQKECSVKKHLRGMHFPERKIVRISIPKGDLASKMFSDILKKHLEYINVQLKIIEDDPLSHQHIILKTYKKDIEISSKNHPYSFEDYYQSLLKLYEELIPQADFTKLKDELSSSAFIQEKVEAPILKTIRKRGKGIINIFIIFLTISFLGLYTLLDASKKQVVHSNFSIPLSPLLIRRTDLMEKMTYVLTESKIAQSSSIIYSALVGVSGSGKTTLARMYAKKCTASVVWEFNAQNQSTLLASYFELGQALSKTEKEKTELEFIHYIKDPQQKRNNLLIFIQGFLKNNPDWLIVFDNVQSPAAIEAFLPQDSSVWGNGHVIITTTNATIKDYPLFPEEQCVQVSTITDKESASLFCQIYYRKQISQLLPKEREALTAFLKKIPSYPLDIALAAHYIKNTHVTFDQYLQKVEDDKADFNQNQQTFLRDKLSYSHTRQHLMALSFKKIMNSHKDFPKILFFLCSINFKNIPKDMLTQLFDGDVVDYFILTLRQFSFLTDQNYPAHDGAYFTISLHPGLQDYGYKFIKSQLENDTEKKYMTDFVDAFKKYITLSNYNPHYLSNLNDHLDHFIECFQSSAITKDEKNKILIRLHTLMGHVKFLGPRHLKEAKKHFEQALYLNTTLNTIPQDELVKIYQDLGAIYIDMVEPHNALTAIQSGLKLCKEEDAFLRSKFIFNLGYASTLLNDVNMAKKYFAQSLVLLEDIESSPDVIGFKSMVLGMQGWLYAATYLNRSDESLKYSKQALDSLEDSHQLEKKTKISRYVSYAYTTRGDIYSKRGEFDKSMKEGFKYAQFIIDYDLDQKPHHFLKIYVGIGGGEYYLRTGQLNQAKITLKDTIKKGKLLLGNDSSLLFVPRVLLMETYLRLSQLERAEKELVYLLNIIITERTMHTRFMDCLLTYNAAILYKELRDFQKCYHFFVTFLHKMRLFLKDFLSPKEFDDLSAQAVFCLPYDHVDPDKNLKAWIEQCKSLLKVVYPDIRFFD